MSDCFIKSAMFKSPLANQSTKDKFRAKNDTTDTRESLTKSKLTA